MRDFLQVALGQVCSLLGTSTVSFALGLWVYQRTHSATQMALVQTAALLPILLLLPIAGVLVDRLRPRRILVLSDGWLLLGTLLLGLAVRSGELWPVYLALAFSSAGTAGRFSALQALSTSLVPERHYARAGALVQVVQALPMAVAPLVGALALA